MVYENLMTKDRVQAITQSFGRRLSSQWHYCLPSMHLVQADYQSFVKDNRVLGIGEIQVRRRDLQFTFPELVTNLAAVINHVIYEQRNINKYSYSMASCARSTLLSDKHDYYKLFSKEYYNISENNLSGIIRLFKDAQRFRLAEVLKRLAQYLNCGGHVAVYIELTGINSRLLPQGFLTKYKCLEEYNKAVINEMFTSSEIENFN